jgi:hypothetical protein
MSMIAQLASDDVLDSAFAWLCRGKRKKKDRLAGGLSEIPSGDVQAKLNAGFELRR